MQEHQPLIVSRSEHGISRKVMNPNALRVLYRLRDNGFIAYLVGGCVRDLLLGREPKDYDVATNATPGEVKRLFRNCRLVGRRFRLAHLHFRDEIIEVATFRAGSDDEIVCEQEGPDNGEHSPVVANAGRMGQATVIRNEDGMLLRDNRFGKPDEDAMRRDFTVNALAYNIEDFSIIDYTGGMADLQNGIIRTIGDPRERFTEDPVRMLRGIRFASLLGFSIERETWEAILEKAETINRATPPRLFEEVLKLFQFGEGVKSYQLLRQTGLFSALFPHMSGWLDEESEGFPHSLTGKAVGWVDNSILAGKSVSQQLFLAFFFGEYVSGKIAAFSEGGIGNQQNLDKAVAELLGEIAPVVLIPNRVALKFREILLLQQRFNKIPGRKPESAVTKPGFEDGLEYLRFRASVAPALIAVVRWWEQCAAGRMVNPPPVLPEHEKTGPKTRRRRRRRKQKKGTAPVSS